MIVDTGQLKRKRDRLSKFLQQAAHICLNSVQALDLLVIVHEHVTVDFVNENFVPDIGLDLTGLLDDLVEFLTGAFVVGIMRVYHIDQRTAVGYVLYGVTFEHVVAREVNDIELDVVVVADSLRLNSTGWKQEESLMR